VAQTEQKLSLILKIRVTGTRWCE